MKYLILFLFLFSSNIYPQSYFKNIKSYNIVPNYKKRIKSAEKYKNRKNSVQKNKSRKNTIRKNKTTRMGKASSSTNIITKSKKSITKYKGPTKIKQKKRNYFRLQSKKPNFGPQQVTTQTIMTAGMIHTHNKALKIIREKGCLGCHGGEAYEGALKANWNEMGDDPRLWATTGNNKYDEDTPDVKLINLQHPKLSRLITVSKGCSNEGIMPLYDGNENELTEEECSTLNTWVRRLARAYGSEASLTECKSNIENSLHYEEWESLTALVGRSINVGCKPGYTGGGTVRCGSDFQFTPEVSCEPTPCILPIENGERLVSNTQNFDGATITCNEGFLPSITDVLFCGPDGSFVTAANQQISCDPIQCDFQIPNGNSITASFGEVAAVNCNEGFNLNPEIQNARCNSDGDFDIETQSNICQGVTCTANVIGGNSNHQVTHTYSSNAISATTRVNCSEGTTPNIEEIQCNSDGNFINPETNESVDIITCERPCSISAVENSDNPNPRTIPSGGTVTVNCNAGYSGNRTYRCENGNLLSEPNAPLICEPQACEEKRFEYSNTVASGVTGDIVTITCENGRTLPTTCRAPVNDQNIGQFDNISCSTDQCILRPIENSNTSSSNTVRNGETIQVNCNQGYALFNSDQEIPSNTIELTCLNNGTFGDNDLSCDPKPCTSRDFLNSSLGDTFSLSGVTNSIRNYSCNQGYIDKQTQSPNGTITCLPSGEFSDDECVPRNCTPSSVPFSENFSVEGSITGKTGESVEIVCNDETYGGGVVTCQPNGTFTTVGCEHLDLQEATGSFAAVEANFSIAQPSPTNPFKKPILAGRFYLYELLAKIYDLDNVLESEEVFDSLTEETTTETKTVKNSLDDNILLNYVYTGDSCDASEQYFPNFIPADNNDWSEDDAASIGFYYHRDLPAKRKCVNAEFFSRMRPGPGTLREGWRISACKEININFSVGRKPLSLIQAKFDNLEINDDSLRYVFHLFNPFTLIPDSGLRAFYPFYTTIPGNSYLDNNDLNFEPLKFIARSLSTNEKWEFIFNTLCVDPSMQIITR